MRLLFILLVSSVFNVLAFAGDYVRLINDGSPINLSITNQQETLLEFDFLIKQIGKNAAAVDYLLTQSVDSRLWITAKVNFNNSKLLIKDKDDRIQVIITLSATTVITPSHYKVNTKKPLVELEYLQKPKQQVLSYVDMTRFLAQKLYAPARLIKEVGLKRIFVSAQSVEWFACSVNLACNGAILATPILQYTNNKYYAIAIKLQNQTNRIIALDPRDITKPYLSAAFQFNTLGAKGSPTDTSVLYLINSSPL